MTHIQIDNLIKGRRKISLKCRHLGLEKGYIYTIYGKNGSGKSSFLKCLANVVNLDSGAINNIGRVGYLPSESNLLMGFNKNTIIKHFKRGSKNFDSKRFEELLFKFKLYGFTDFKDLSKGEKKCILLSLILSLRPNTLLLDEPFNGLDGANKMMVKEVLLDYMADSNRTIIMAINQLDDVYELSDYFIQITNGTINKPLSQFELTQEYHIINIRREDINLYENSLICKERTAEGYRLLVKGEGNTEVLDILTMLGGI